MAPGDFVGKVARKVSRRIQKEHPSDVLFRKVRNAANTGDLDGALTLARKAIAAQGVSIDNWGRYAYQLEAVGQLEAAAEILRVGMHQESMSQALLDRYLQLCQRRPKIDPNLQWLQTYLIEVVRTSEEFPFPAIFYLLVTDSGQAFLELETIQSAGAQQLQRAIHEGDPTIVEQLQDPHAYGLYYLYTQQYEQAKSFLAQLPQEELSQSAFQFLFRTEEDPQRVRDIANRMRGANADLDRAIGRGVEEWISKHSYPFAQRNTARTPVASKNILYLLHNSLPWDSAGYATRTHGLLTSIRGYGWNIQGMTRPGYPVDRIGEERALEIAAEDTVDEIRYTRALGGNVVYPKSPLYNYTEMYSDLVQEFAEREQIALIHAASNHWNGLAAINAANRLNLPSIYEVRGLWEITRWSREPNFINTNRYKYMAGREADSAKAATKVFAITRALKQEMISRGVDEDKIILLPNAVDSSRFEPRDRDEQLVRELGLQGKTVIGYVGSILDYEGIDILLEATATLAANRDDFHVLIVGDGTFMDTIREQREQLNLQRHVTLTGRVPHDQVEAYYSVIDITPFPRKPQPVCEMVSPLKPFEAMAMGKTVIAANVDALEEIVTPDHNGILFNKGDAQDLANQLQTLLDNPEYAKKLGQQSRQWVVQERDWKQVGKIVADTYAALLGKD